MSWLVSLGAASSLVLVYVGGLYVFSSGRKDRDDPSTIRRRFLSAFATVVVSPFVVMAFGPSSLLRTHSLWRVIGVRSDGLLSAVFLPTLLTAVLFSGPLAVSLASSDSIGTRTKLLALLYSASSDLTFWRNYVVAPFTEEFTFRACMLPILLGGFSPFAAAVVSPMLFGVAHFHHMTERMRNGLNFTSALLISSFQFCYTTVFGVYSAYIFIQTGHLASCAAVHSFCNFMGFPDFAELLRQPPAKRLVLSAVYVAGAVLFYKLAVGGATDPSLFSNTIYSW